MASNGFQPDTKSPSSRRADFDLRRRIVELERTVDALPAADLAAVVARLDALEARIRAAGRNLAPP